MTPDDLKPLYGSIMEYSKRTDDINRRLVWMMGGLFFLTCVVVCVVSWLSYSSIHTALELIGSGR